MQKIKDGEKSCITKSILMHLLNARKETRKKIKYKTIIDKNNGERILLDY